MSDHLPECPWADRGFAFPCICDRLRACEQRVRVNERDWRDQSFGLGYAAGLAAARKAVEALPYECFDVNSDPSDWLLREDVLDVIDNEEER